MKEAGLHILNSEVSLLRTCQHEIVSGCLGTEPDFSWLGLLLFFFGQLG